jgi:hypothetical protein
VTVPVAAEGETVAVRVTLAPVTEVVGDAVSVTVLAVAPVLDGACQKSPQPANRDATARVSSIRTILVQARLFFIRFPHHSLSSISNTVPYTPINVT